MEECGSIDEMAKKLGFEGEKELNHLVSAVDLSTPDKIRDFKKWQFEDGTKEGLLTLPSLP